VQLAIVVGILEEDQSGSIVTTACCQIFLPCHFMFVEVEMLQLGVGEILLRKGMGHNT
jgi:hypothetical protein